MSSLFNQTNIAPGTAFSGSGGSSSIPNNLSTVNVYTSSILFNSGDGGMLESYSQSGTGWPGGVIVGNQASPANLTANRYYFTDGIGQGVYKQNYIDITGMYWQGQSTGVSKQFLNWIGNGGGGNEAFALQNTSTITGPSGQPIRIAALASTLASVYPGCVG